MNLENFIDLINNITEYSTVVLLEGKRNVLEEDKPKLTELGRKLALIFPKVTFRTGNASGADELFAKGVCAIDPSRIEYILPYKGHRKKNISEFSYTASVDEIILAKEPQIAYYTKVASIKNCNMIEQYENGERNKIAIKASYLLRDTIKVIGSETLNLRKADAAIIYDDLDNPGKGGTGHTIRVCKQNNAPVIIQDEWFNWL